MGNPENPEGDGKKKPVKVNQYQYQDLSNLNQPDATNVVNNVRIPDMKKIEEQKVVKNTTAPKIENLKLSIGGDLAEKAKDPDIKNATEKILGKELQGTIINKLVINQEVFAGKNISDYTGKVLKTHPELTFFMAQLGIADFADKKYEQLSATQKIILLALEDTLNGKTWNIIKIDTYTDDKGKIDLAKFQDAYANKMSDILGHINDEALITQASNFGVVKKTLKDDYKLTETEATKYLALMEAIKNQPKAYQEAGMGLNGILLLVAFVLGAVCGISLYKMFFEAGPTQSTINNEVIIAPPHKIAKLLASEMEFTAKSDYEKEQWQINGNDPLRVQFLKKSGNKFQNRKLVMQIDGKMALEYDISKEDTLHPENNPLQMRFYRDAHALKIRIINPKPIIHEFTSKIMQDNTQVVQTKGFENMPMALQDTIFNTVKRKVDGNRSILDQSIGHVAKNFYDLYADILAEGGMRLDTLVIQMVDDNGNEIMTKGFGSSTLKKPPTSTDGLPPINIDNTKK